MNLRRTWAVARKESIHVIRDPRALGVSIALPLVLLLLFGYALTLDVDHVPLLLWDQSRTPESRDLGARFTGSPYFDLVAAVDSYGDIEEALDHNRALMALVIPVDFGRRVASGRPAEVQVIADGVGRQHGDHRRELRGGHRPGLFREPESPARPSDRDAPAAAAPGGQPPGLVQHGHGVHGLHRAGAHRHHHDAHRGPPHIPDGGEGVGDGHHGAAHLHPRAELGGRDRQALPLRGRGRPGHGPGGPCGAVPLPRSPAGQPAGPRRHVHDLPRGRPLHGNAHQHRHAEPAPREPGGLHGHVPPRLPPIGVHVRHQQHAQGAPVDHLPHPRPVLRGPAEGALPEGGRARPISTEKGYSSSPSAP